MVESDESIALRVQKGDVDAFGELISRYEQKLRRYARKFIRGEDDIDDVVQEVFIKAYVNIQSFDTSLRFSPWIYRIAHNSYVNELRRRGKESLSLFPSADTILPLIPGTLTADSETLSREVEEHIEELLGLLPSHYREVLVLSNFEGLTYEEIAEVLKISLSAVGVRLMRARVKLKELYIQRFGTYG